MDKTIKRSHVQTIVENGGADEVMMLRSLLLQAEREYYQSYILPYLTSNEKQQWKIVIYDQYLGSFPSLLDAKKGGHNFIIQNGPVMHIGPPDKNIES